MNFNGYSEAKRFAAERLNIAKSESGDEHVEIEAQREPDEKLVNRLIEMQVESWGKDKPQDYRKYASYLWEKATGAKPNPEDSAFKAYEATLIKNLLSIKTSEYVYPHVNESMGKLVAKYGNRVNGVSLWSTGDVSSTGFQISKIEGSRVIQNFMHGALNGLPKSDAKEFIRRKTHFLVDDDKFGSLEDYARLGFENSSTHKQKFVIIEDTDRNFEKARLVIERAATAGHGQFEVIPIWAGYSRYAKKGEQIARARGKLPEFHKKKKDLNTIGSFADLLNEQKFGKILDGAELLFDFDGVIMDDDKRRLTQTTIVYNTICSETKKLGISEMKLVARLLKK